VETQFFEYSIVSLCPFAVVLLLELPRRNVADGLEQTRVVEPV